MFFECFLKYLYVNVIILCSGFVTPGIMNMRDLELQVRKKEITQFSAKVNKKILIEMYIKEVHLTLK